MDLVILSPLRVGQLPDGRILIPRKLMEGVERYRDLWPGKVTLLLEPSPHSSSNLDEEPVDPRSLDVPTHVVSFDSVSAAELIAAADIVLATLDSPQNFVAD